MSRLSAPVLVAITLAVICHLSVVHSAAVPSEPEEAHDDHTTVASTDEHHPPAAVDHSHDHDHDHDHDLEEAILKKIADNKEFQKRIRPNETTHVKINMYVRDAHMKSDVSKTASDPVYPWTLDLTFRQYWNDPRLAYTVSPNDTHFHGYFPLNTLKGIWKPDLFFPSAENAEFHEVMTPNELIWLYPNGDILYSVRIHLTLLCHHHKEVTASGLLGLAKGTGTHVTCPFRMASYGYTADQLTIDWDTEDPVQLDPIVKAKSSEYCHLDEVTPAPTTESTTKIGKFQTTKAEFHFTC